MDVCHKVQYPPAHHCQTLVESGEILAEIPFIMTPGFFPTDFSSDPGNPWPSADMALTAMWSHGGVPHPVPGPITPSFQFAWILGSDTPTRWGCMGRRNYLEFHMDSRLLNPDWHYNLELDFSIAFTAPNYPDVPEWCQLFFDELQVPFAGGSYEMVVNRQPFYEDDVYYTFRPGPIFFNYAQILQLPSYGGLEGYGFHRGVSPAFNFRLIVRRRTGIFYLKWPKSVWKADSYAALVDSVSGEVIGPAIPS
jgi:hypothetical protein